MEGHASRLFVRNLAKSDPSCGETGWTFPNNGQFLSVISTQAFIVLRDKDFLSFSLLPTTLYTD